MPALIVVEEEKLETFRRLDAKCHADGLNEVEWRELRSWAESEGLRLTRDGMVATEVITENWRAEGLRFTGEEQSALGEANELQRQLGQLFDTYFGTVMPQQPDSELTVRTEQLAEAEQRLADVRSVVAVPDERPLADLSLLLKDVRAAIERALSSIQRAREATHTRERSAAAIAGAELRRAEVSPRLDRANRAIDAIEGILRDSGKEDHMRRVVADILGDVNLIFGRLHCPREFSAIELVDGTSTFVLKRTATGTSSQVTQISSGQRAALALSIFLAMNRRLSAGPPLMLFDDPLAYTDDLNVLSFLDYLRDVVMAGQRQVFFATASRKAANLFEKKFACFGNKFSHFQFERLAP